jgi:hypothetical protein
LRGVIVIRLDLGELVKVALKKGEVGKVTGLGRDMGLLGFVALVYVWVYFCCCSGGGLCQGLQEAGVGYSWYSRIVSGWLMYGRER